MNVFNYENYKDFLNAIFTIEGKGRGQRSKLAKYIGCQNGFISHVLNGHVNFSLEQTLKVTDFLKLDQAEADFFMLLVQQERAGSVALKNYFKSQVDQILKKRSQIKERIKVKSELDERDYLIYYGHWYYSAIHIATSIPALQTVEAMEKELGIPRRLIKDVLKFLTEKALVEEVGGIFKIGKTRIHVDRNSPLFIKHHTNWRIEAIKALEKTQDGLHYSGVISLSEEDGKKVKEVLLGAIERAENILIESPEEKLMSISLDFFEI